MTQPLSFDHLQAILRQHTADLPDVRKPSPNRLCWLMRTGQAQTLWERVLPEKRPRPLWPANVVARLLSHAFLN